MSALHSPRLLAYLGGAIDSSQQSYFTDEPTEAESSDLPQITQLTVIGQIQTQAAWSQSRAINPYTRDIYYPPSSM